MTQLFDAAGRVQSVTAIHAVPNIVTQVKTKEKDGYDALQLGCGEKKRASKALCGHLKDIPSLHEGRSFWRLKEVRTEHAGIERGNSIDLSLFAVGDHVDVIGWSKGRGYAGVVKRHHFHGQKASHGHKDQERMPGSIGAGGVQHVFKGKRMAGHMGDSRVTVKNLEVVRIDLDQNVLYVRGGVPGSFNGLVLIRAVGTIVSKKSSTQPAEQAPTPSVDTPSEMLETSEAEEQKPQE